jgi:peptide/nickel transport system substrate-binding protein
MADKSLRWDKNFTGPWFLLFPGYNDADSPFHDKRVREAVSLAINRVFLTKQETQGIGPPIGNWVGTENRDTLQGDGTDLPIPEYNAAKAKQLLAAAGFPNGFDYDWYIPFPPYFEMAERVMNDLRAVGMRGKLQTLDGAAFRGRIGQGRKGYPGDRSIVQNVDPRPGGVGAAVAVYAACGSTSDFICEPQIEALWKKYQASLDMEERDDLIRKIQRILIQDYYIVPMYLNPFVQAVGPRVLPEGDGFHRYWDTNNAPYPWPWEVWAVKADK